MTSIAESGCSGIRPPLMFSLQAPLIKGGKSHVATIEKNVHLPLYT